MEPCWKNLGGSEYGRSTFSTMPFVPSGQRNRVYGLCPNACPGNTAGWGA
jgi:hypothetical protein